MTAPRYSVEQAAGAARRAAAGLGTPLDAAILADLLTRQSERIREATDRLRSAPLVIDG